MANERRREEEDVSKVLYLNAAPRCYYSLAILEKSVITLTWEQVK